VDWARSVLRAGDPVRELSEGYARLVERVAVRRQEQNRCFAELLRDQVAAAGQPSDLVLVERVLDEVVAPLAALAPVLVILLDGMSPAVSRELLADLARLDWVSLGPEGQPMRAGLAAIPCVTEASRASLFCGRPCTGTADNEAAGFAGHAGLRSHCRSGSPPVLFHKVALQEAADASLAANVREAIASTQKRVVGVVINAVDDHLLKGEQLDLRWTRDEIKVLPSLLYEARSARRVVVVLSDHGHLLDHQTQGRPGEGGERWRPDDGQAREGGPTPQEMVIPITVLAAGDIRLAGWAEAPDPTPEWWEAAPLGRKNLTQRRRGAKKEEKEGRELDTLSSSSFAPLRLCVRSSEWIAALLASPLFIEQKKLGGRAVPADDLFGRLLADDAVHPGRWEGPAVRRREVVLPGLHRRLVPAVGRRRPEGAGGEVLPPPGPGVVLRADVIRPPSSRSSEKERSRVPVVDPGRIPQVQVVDRLPRGLVPLLERPDEDQQGQHPGLVEARAQQLPGLVQGQGLELAGQLPQRRHLDPEETVALAVLARPRLEEATQALCELLVGQCVQPGFGFPCRHGHPS